MKQRLGIVAFVGAAVLVVAAAVLFMRYRNTNENA